MQRQHLDILRPVGECRHLDFEDVEAIEQVFAKPSLLDGAL